MGYTGPWAHWSDGGHPPVAVDLDAFDITQAEPTTTSTVHIKPVPASSGWTLAVLALARFGLVGTAMRTRSYWR